MLDFCSRFVLDFLEDVIESVMTRGRGKMKFVGSFASANSSNETLVDVEKYSVEGEGVRTRHKGASESTLALKRSYSSLDASESFKDSMSNHDSEDGDVPHSDCNSASASSKTSSRKRRRLDTSVATVGSSSRSDARSQPLRRSPRLQNTRPASPTSISRTGNASPFSRPPLDPLSPSLSLSPLPPTPRSHSHSHQSPSPSASFPPEASPVTRLPNLARILLSPPQAKAPPSPERQSHPNDSDLSASYEEEYSGESGASATPLSPSPPLSSRSAPTKGDDTRVQISFETYESVLLRSSNAAEEETIERAATSIVSSPTWTELLDAYVSACSGTGRYLGHVGERKETFIRLMNFVMDEAENDGRHDVTRHRIRFGRFHHDGSSADPVGYSWRDDAASPCLGTIEPSPSSTSPPSASAWLRTAIILDVYTPQSDESPRESPVRPAKRKLSDSDSDSSSPEPEPAPRPVKKQRRIKGHPQPQAADSEPEAGHVPKPRLSWIELENEYYVPRKPEHDLLDSASRLSRATGNRRHVLGIFAKRCEVQFYFVDHAGVVYTEGIDLREEDGARTAVKAVLRMGGLDARGLGVEPYFLARNSLSASGNGGEKENEDLTACLGKTSDLVFDVDGMSFRAQKMIYADTLVGRGTVVYDATPILSPSSSSSSSPSSPSSSSDPVPPIDDVVLKLSWHPHHTRSEDTLLRLATSHNIPGVIKLYRSAVVARLSDGFRAKLTPEWMYGDRELRVQITGPRAMPLYKVKDLETFKTAYRSLVAAHHELFTKVHILHRDISAGNLMVNREDHSQGILIDLDLAALVDESGDPMPLDPSSSPNFTTTPPQSGPNDRPTSLPPAGTLMFRATDLIKPNLPTKAYYRHDLESFFYVLLWMQTHWKDGEPFTDPESQELNFDFDQTWEATQQVKRGVVLNHERCQRILGPLPLRDTWIHDLWKLFGSSFRAHTIASWDAEEGIGEPPDEATLGGRLTFEEFGKALGLES